MKLQTFDLQSLVTSYQKYTSNSVEFLFFWGHSKSDNQEIDKNCLSNWYPAQFKINGIVYPTVEHYMMAQKSLLFKDHGTYKKILAAKSPKEAKILGRRVQNFNETIWIKYRYRIVKEGCLAKFSLNPDLASFLLSTVNKIIVEASPYDKIWGIGMTEQLAKGKSPAKWQGLNLLGFVLMDVRKTLLDWSVKQIKEYTDIKYITKK